MDTGLESVLTRLSNEFGAHEYQIQLGKKKGRLEGQVHEMTKKYYPELAAKVEKDQVWTVDGGTLDELKILRFEASRNDSTFKRISA